MNKILPISKATETRIESSFSNSTQRSHFAATCIGKQTGNQSCKEKVPEEILGLSASTGWEFKYNQNRPICLHLDNNPRNCKPMKLYPKTINVKDKKYSPFPKLKSFCFVGVLKAYSSYFF